VTDPSRKRGSRVQIPGTFYAAKPHGRTFLGIDLVGARVVQSRDLSPPDSPMERCRVALRFLGSILISWSILLATHAWALDSKRVAVLPPAITPVVGESYFTRYNFWQERGVHVTTNYTRGAFVPINTRVKLVSLQQKKMLLGLPSGETVTIELAEQFSLRPLAEIASELLGTQPVPIEKLGDELASSIRSGEMRLGMTKEQVVLTRGYPPRHRTPTLEANQ